MNKLELNKAFQAADDAWGDELQYVYGKSKAGDYRYQRLFNGACFGPKSRLGALYRAKEAARIAWEAVAFGEMVK